jgi:hypothetical protein
MDRRKSPEQPDTPNEAVNVACFVGAFLMGLSGGLPAVLIFAFAAAQQFSKRHAKKNRLLPALC